MSIIRNIVKFFVPVNARDYIRNAHREYVFNRAMKKFLAGPEILMQSGNPVIKDLIYGWGNESWSALDEYLIGCIERAQRLDGPILECGSGLSTILVGAIAQSRGNRHFALEHVPEWAKRVQGCLDKYKIDSVTLSAKPLKDYGEFSWYDAPMDVMPESFAMVICDGPPGATKGGRYGLGPVMSQHLKAGCVIMLDDAGREQELATAKRWETELDATSTPIGLNKPYMEMTVGTQNFI